MKRSDRYDSLFHYYAEQNDVPWLLLKSQVKAESNFDPLAMSPVGASGLAQFMPKTFNEWVTKLNIHSPNPFNPEHSIQCQAAYMRWLMDQFPGELDRAIASYNFGVGNEHNHRPWPVETVNYVKRVNRYLAEYTGVV